MPPAAPAFTQACEDRDFAEWHQGCAWCAVWVLWLRAPALAQRVQRARQALGPRLWPGYARQPHVTVAYRGLMAQGAGPAAATFGVAQLRADIARLQHAPAWPRVLRVQGSGSFTTVPYLGLDVADAAALQPLHKALVPEPPAPAWHYVPHVTLGHYAQSVPMAPVLHTLQAALAGLAPLACAAPQLWLVRYRTHAIAGPLVAEGCLDLATRRYTALPGALLRP